MKQGRTSQHPPRAGIKDLARSVGMSVSTVSRALNGYSDVSQETRRKIEAAAREIGYRPNYAASVLRNQQTQTVAFMVSKPWTKFVDPFFLGLLDGLEMALQARGYDLQVVMARELDSELPILQRLVERGRCDGVLFGRTRPQDDRVDYLIENGFPFAALGQTERNDHDWIDRDHFAIARQATQRLIDLGHTRIAMLSTPLRYTYSNHALRGYRAALAEAGLPHDPALEGECFLSRRTGEEVFTELVVGGLGPTAVFCGNDTIAMSAMQGMTRLGLHPGRDTAVIGCDDVPLAAHTQPALTTFAQDLDAIGMRMGMMILSRLSGRQETQGVTVETNLVLRDSDCPLHTNATHSVR